jgi:hypothetical protein
MRPASSCSDRPALMIYEGDDCMVFLRPFHTSVTQHTLCQATARISDPSLLKFPPAGPSKPQASAHHITSEPLVRPFQAKTLPGPFNG